MTGPKIIFFVLGIAILVFSVLSITSRRILRGAIYLLFVLVAMAGLYYMMNFEFLAAVQLILYAGGIVVLIIFSILLTSQINSKLDPPKFAHLLAALAVGISGLAMAAGTIMHFAFEPAEQAAVPVDMQTIGTQLMDTQQEGYALPFEVISVLLLAALVGSIFVARKTNA